MFVKKEIIENLNHNIEKLNAKIKNSSNYCADLELKVKALERYLKVELHRDYIFEYKPIKLEDRND